jgi:shikimate kinase
MSNTTRFTLVGMSGVGKTTTSKLLAQELEYAYVESDFYIEEFAELEGIDPEALTDEEFIALADRAILKLEIPDKIVIDSGGSLIYAKQAMQRLKEISTVIYLSDSVDNIQRKFEKRGVELRLVGGAGKTFEELCLERAALYQDYAHITLDVSSHDTPEKVVETIRQETNKTA